MKHAVRAGLPGDFWSAYVSLNNIPLLLHRFHPDTEDMQIVYNHAREFEMEAETLRFISAWNKNLILTSCLAGKLDLIFEL